jgi:hypothetical protein
MFLNLIHKGIPLLIILFTAVTWQPGFGQTRRTSSLEDKWPRYSLEAGFYTTNISSNFRLGAKRLGIGLEINFEDALGLNTSSFTFTGNFLYRFSKNRKSALQASYFQITRKASKTLETDLEIRDTVFTAGTTLGTKFKLGVVQLDYSYSILLDDRVNLYASFGFYVVPLSFSINRDEKRSEQSDFIAPLPNFGLGTFFYLTPKLLIIQRLNVFYLRIPDFEGSMTDIHVGLEYHPWKHVAFGAGYNAFNINVEATKKGMIFTGDLIGNVGYKQNGVVLYGTVSF